jgi:predicted DNA-binding mobile mystery protein A
MKHEERELARRALDKELRPFRVAGKQKNPTQELLRRVRHVLGVPLAEVAREVGVNRSVILRLEESEGRGTISLRSMSRVAGALNCKMVYALVPQDGGTLGEMADRRKWVKILGVRG